MNKQIRGLIIGFISLTFLLPLSFWYISLFNTSTFFQSIPQGSYFVIGGLISLMFAVIYLILKG